MAAPKPSARSRTDAGRRRAGSRPTLHPARLLELFRRAVWPAKLVILVLLGVLLFGATRLLLPFTVDRPHPDPPPLTLRMTCPPAAVSAIAGAGGLSNPVPSVPDWAEVHDDVCRAAGRSRSVTGLLLASAAFLNAAAVLEWGHVRRRARRRGRHPGRRHGSA